MTLESPISDGAKMLFLLDNDTVTLDDTKIAIEDRNSNYGVQRWAASTPL